MVVVNLISHTQLCRKLFTQQEQGGFKAACLLQRCLNLLYIPFTHSAFTQYLISTFDYRQTLLNPCSIPLGSINHRLGLKFSTAWGLDYNLGPITL